MGSSYRPDNPFAPKKKYSADNPFAPKEEDFSDVRGGVSSAPEKPKEGASDRLRGLVQSGLQGATLGFGDEMTAGVRAVLPEKLGGTEGFDYSGAVKEERESLGEFRGRHPVASAAAEIVGSLPAAIATGGAAMRGATLAQKIGTGAKVGTGYGAVAGTGNAEGPTEKRLKGAAIGALAGGATGAVLPVAGRGLGKIADIVGYRPAKAASTRADDLIVDALKRDEVTIPQLRGAPQDITAQTKPRIFADLAGENTKGLARAAQATPSLAKNQLSDTLKERHAGQLGRITDDLEGTLNLKGRDVYEVADEVVARRKAAAEPLYAKAYEHGAVDVPEITELLKRPALARALRGARATAADEGITLPQGQVDVRTLDYVKRSLDDRISALSRQGKNDKARVLRNVKDQMLDRLDAAVPDFKAARSAFAGESALKDALENGGKMLNEDSRLTAKAIGKMSDPEREMYRLGAIDAIRQKMKDTPNRRDLVKRIFDSPDQRETLRVLFPDEKTFGEFAKRMEHESRMVSTKEGILGGSPTARIQSELSDMGGFNVGDMAVNAAMGGGIQGAAAQSLKAFLRRRSQGVSGGVADNLSRRLQTSPREVALYSRMLDELERSQSQPLLKTSRATKVLGAKAGGSSTR